MPYQQKNITLSELSLQEVFTNRLNQQQWPLEIEIPGKQPTVQSTKQRLNQLFRQAVEQVQQQQSGAENGSQDSDKQ